MKHIFRSRHLTLHIYFIAFATSWPLIIYGQYYEMSDLAIAGYESLIDLRMPETNHYIQQLQDLEPKNHVRHWLSNYRDCIRIFISEDKELFDSLKVLKQMRINALDESNYQSPYRLYALAEIHIQWAFCRMKFGEYVAAVTDIKRAYKLLEENTALFPEFKANKKNLGILHALVGTVPDEFKWAVKMLGMNGTIEQGGSELETLLSETSDKYLFHKEAQVYYAYFLLHLNNEPDKAWQVLQSSNLDPSQSLAASFVFANVAMHTMQNDLALSYLENRPRGAAYIEFPYLDFMAGVAKLQQLDTAAQAHLETFIAHPTVRHYKKEAYQKLAWLRLIFYGEEAYRKTMVQCKKNGTTATDEDKTAQREARNGLAPNKHLLKARILFDGGYHQRAYNYLTTEAPNRYDAPMLQIEYYYRLARICDGLEKEVEAIHYYDMTIREGRYESSYYAANSALQLGQMFERQGKMDLSKTYFKTCLSMEPDEYRNSLHQKAKAGLNRVLSTSAN